MKFIDVKVSVIILNYNGTKFLRKLFYSLEKQTYNNFEVIFIDNASTDESLDELKDILSENLVKFDVKIVRNSRNLGYCGGNNIGLKYASGKYLVFLNNDTYLASKWLEELVKVLENYPNIGACQSRLIFADTSNIQSDGWISDIYGWGKKIIVNEKKKITKTPFYISGASFIIRKAVLNKIGGFDSKLFFGDYDLSWRIRLVGYELASNIGSICYHYGGRSIRSLYKDCIVAFYNFKEIIRVFIKNYSRKSLLKGLLPATLIMFISAKSSSLKNKNPLYFIMLFKAIIWNLKNIRDTLLSRRKVQIIRKVKDKEIEKRMFHYPMLLT